jgi:glycosyltransferase involved in cell wall biosynthesis
MTSIPVSVYIITLNEELHLQRLLPQLADFDEVVIVDSGSMDRTSWVATSFPNVRFSTHPWQGFGRQKMHALSLCRNEWVLNLDADEELTDGYLHELLDCLKRDDTDALESERRLLRWGKMPRNFMKHDVLIRLFRKACGDYTDVKVHERILIKGRIRRTKAYLLHHENLSYAQRIQKSIQYSTLKADDKFAKGASCHFLHLALSFPLAFVQCYFFKGCFLDGCNGILVSMNHASYSFMKYANLWELQQQKARRGLPVIEPEARPTQK